jgi:hypothetical protein
MERIGMRHVADMIYGGDPFVLYAIGKGASQ